MLNLEDVDTISVHSCLQFMSFKCIFLFVKICLRRIIVKRYFSVNISNYLIEPYGLSFFTTKMSISSGEWRGGEFKLLFRSLVRYTLCCQVILEDTWKNLKSFLL